MSTTGGRGAWLFKLLLMMMMMVMMLMYLLGPRMTPAAVAQRGNKDDGAMCVCVQDDDGMEHWDDGLRGVVRGSLKREREGRGRQCWWPEA